MSSNNREIAIHALQRYLTKNYSQFIDMSNVGGKSKDLNRSLISRCIAALAIKIHNNDIDEEVCALSVCDGSDDHGVDALYINHDKKLVTIVQAKFDVSGNGSIARSEINDFFNSCKEIMLEKYHLFNSKFRRSEIDLDRAYDESYKYVFCFAYSGGKQLSDEVISIIDQAKNDFNYDIGIDVTSISIVNLDDMRDYISNPNSKKIDMDDVEVLQYGLNELPLPSVHGIITGDIVCRWWEEYGEKIFEKNIRGGLGNSSDVNQSIKETVINRPDYFYYFNNGITILVDDFSPRRRNNISRRESGGFDFKNISVINGAQTITTIGNAYLSGEVSLEELSKIKISCRFIKSLIEESCEDDLTPNDVEKINVGDISLDITIANNNQNKVVSRDFASKDPIQIELRKSISLEPPYQYEIKRSDTLQSNDSDFVIDMDDALNALVCCNFSIRNIANLKSNRGRFFESLTGQLYRSVFNQGITSVKVINSVNFYRACLNRLNSLEGSTSVKRDEKIIIHGRYVFISIIMNNYTKIINSSLVLSPDEIPNFDEDIQDAFKIISNYIESNYPTSHMPRFFENQTKLKEVYNLFSM